MTRVQMRPMQRLKQALLNPVLSGANMVMAAMILAGCASASPPDSDVAAGRLAPCPDKPNCVVSQAGDPGRRIDPITYTGEPAAAMRILEQVVQEMPGARIVSRTDRTIHAEYRTKWLGFVDDVVFYFADEPVIHLRSASRKGYYDFGVNRKRVEQIRQRFQARLIRGDGK